MNNRLDRNLRREHPGERLKRYIKEHPKAKRIISAYIDMLAVTAVFYVIGAVVLMLAGMSLRSCIEWYAAYIKEHYVPPVSYVATGFVPIILKDALPVSPGKAITGLRIAENGGKAPLWKRVVRNVTVVIWPVEAAALLLTGRRVSDRLLGLDVVEQAKEQ